MRVVIVGAGGVGGTLGARLSEAGHDIAFLARGRSLAALRETGLSLQSPLGDVTLGPGEASDDPAALGAAEALIVTVKLYDLAALAPRLGPLLRAETSVLPLQNGVEAHAILASALATVSPLKGTVSIKAHAQAPGNIVCKSPFCKIKLAEADGATSARVQALAAVLNDCVGIEAVISSDIDADLWHKFVMLASFSAVSCLARANIGQVLASDEACALLHDAAEEAAAVGRASGVSLPHDIAALVSRQVQDMPKDGKPSMLEDLEAGRPLELPFLSGAVVRLGQRRGVATPIHSAAYRALAMHAAGAGN